MRGGVRPDTRKREQPLGDLVVGKIVASDAPELLEVELAGRDVGRERP